jgi:hypothetical protein
VLESVERELTDSFYSRRFCVKLGRHCRMGLLGGIGKENRVLDTVLDCKKFG